MSSNNIPTRFPSFVNEEGQKAITEWIKTRPDHSHDTCVNRHARWKYTYQDHGIWGEVTVIDTAVAGARKCIRSSIRSRYLVKP